MHVHVAGLVDTGERPRFHFHFSLVLFALPLLPAEIFYVCVSELVSVCSCSTNNIDGFLEWSGFCIFLVRIIVLMLNQVALSRTTELGCMDAWQFMMTVKYLSKWYVTLARDKRTKSTVLSNRHYVRFPPKTRPPWLLTLRHWIQASDGGLHFWHNGIVNIPVMADDRIMWVYIYITSQYFFVSFHTPFLVRSLQMVYYMILDTIYNAWSIKAFVNLCWSPIAWWMLRFSFCSRSLAVSSITVFVLAHTSNTVLG
jgi:hypothetical protein